MSIFKSMLSSIVVKNMRKKLTDWTIQEEDITEILKQIRNTLLDADVNLLVVKNFIKNIRQKAIGYVIDKSQEPSDVLISIIKKELITILGKNTSELKINFSLNNIMFVGLQGSGKTTSIAKLANRLLKEGKKPMLVALDIYRPAAIDQLKSLAQKINVYCFSATDQEPQEIAKKALIYAQENGYDTILYDTAGRLQTNEQLMNELSDIKRITNSQEIIMVVDCMAGQDIINVVTEFNNVLHLTGLIITKLDSNARAGAVLSIVYLLNLPIKFIGNGEGVNNLDTFYPDRIADQILGLGDIATLAEKASNVLEDKITKKSFTKMISGNFDLDDLLNQTRQLSKMGSLSGLINLVPGLANKISDDQINEVENKINIWTILISSMTIKERRNPNLLKNQPNRRIRILKGSGRKPDELNKMLSQWSKAKQQLQEIGKKIKSGKNPFSDLLNK